MNRRPGEEIPFPPVQTEIVTPTAVSMKTIKVSYCPAHGEHFADDAECCECTYDHHLDMTTVRYREFGLHYRVLSLIETSFLTI